MRLPIYFPLRTWRLCRKRSPLTRRRALVIHSPLVAFRRPHLVVHHRRLVPAANNGVRLRVAGGDRLSLDGNSRFLTMISKTSGLEIC